MTKLYLYHNPDLANKETRKKVRDTFLQTTLQAESGAESPLEIARREKGKPFLPSYPDLCFNMSDSGAYAALVLSQTEIGLDLETIRPHPYREVLPRWFAESEYRFLSDNDSPKELIRFIHLWTCKESLLKHVGCGLGAEMRSHRVRWRTTPQSTDPETYALYKDNELCFDSFLIQKGRILPWNVESARMGDLICTVCRQKDEFPVTETLILEAPIAPKEKF